MNNEQMREYLYDNAERLKINDFHEYAELLQTVANMSECVATLDETLTDSERETLKREAKTLCDVACVFEYLFNH